MKTTNYNPATVYLSSLNSPVSVRNGKVSLNYLCKLMNNTNLNTFEWSKFDYVALLNIRRQLIEKNLLASTINTYISSLRSVCTEAWRLNIISTDEYLRLKNVKNVRGKSDRSGRALSVDELRKIIAYSANNKKSLRDSTIIALGYGAGLRISEITKLNIETCTTEKIKIHGKGGVIRSVFIPAFVRELLDNWLSILNKNSGAVFCCMARGGHIRDKRISPRTVHEIITLRYKSADIKKFSPHDLRRSFGTHLLNSGVDLLVVQRLMRHASVNTTKIYDHRGDEAEKAAIEMLPF